MASSVTSHRQISPYMLSVLSIREALLYDDGFVRTIAVKNKVDCCAYTMVSMGSGSNLRTPRVLDSLIK